MCFLSTKPFLVYNKVLTLVGELYCFKPKVMNLLDQRFRICKILPLKKSCYIELGNEQKVNIRDNLRISMVFIIKTSFINFIHRFQIITKIINSQPNVNILSSVLKIPPLCIILGHVFQNADLVIASKIASINCGGGVTTSSHHKEKDNKISRRSVISNQTP